MKKLYCVKLNYNTRFYFKGHASAVRVASLVNEAEYALGLEDSREITISQVDEDLPVWESLDGYITAYFKHSIIAWRKAKGKTPEDLEEARGNWSEYDYTEQREMYDYSFRVFYDAGYPKKQEAQEAA